MSTTAPPVSSGQNELVNPPPLPPASLESQTETLHRGNTSPCLGSPPPSPASVSQCEHLLQTHAWLTVFAIWGCLARLGISALTTYPGAVMPGVSFANFAGCMIMGFLNQDRHLFHLSSGPEKQRSTPPPKSSIPLYVGLATGFCGSFTSFSSMLLDAFRHMANIEPSYDRPTKGYNFLAFWAYIVAALALAVGGGQVGRHVAAGLSGVLGGLPRWLLQAPTTVVAALAMGHWVGAVLMAVFVGKWRGDALFACVFAPLGVFVRFWLSRWCNPLVRTFPVGTFACNTVGSAILAAMMVGRYEVGTKVGCQLLQGVGDGFCGCLTTVSTFVVEFTSLGKKHAYIYAVGSVTVSLCIYIIVLGSYVWSHGDEHLQLCSPK